MLFKILFFEFMINIYEIKEINKLFMEYQVKEMDVFYLQNNKISTSLSRQCFRINQTPFCRIFNKL